MNLFDQDAIFPSSAFDLLSPIRYPLMQDVVCEIKKAFAASISPEKIEGATAAYLLRDCKKKPLAIFKAQGYLHECTAHLLDYKAFAGVPPTVVTSLHHPILGGLALGGEVIGSCQLFYKGRSLNPADVQNLKTAKSIRRIALLDMRLLNSDRHSGNILVHKDALIPVDHHLTLPPQFFGCSFGWSHWPGAHTSFSAEEKNYITHLDAEKERQFLLEKIGLPISCGNLHFIALQILKAAMDQDLNAHQLSFFYRLSPDILPTRTLAPLPKNLPIIRDLFKVMNYLSEDAFWSSQKHHTIAIKDCIAHFAATWKSVRDPYQRAISNLLPSIPK